MSKADEMDNDLMSKVGFFLTEADDKVEDREDDVDECNVDVVVLDVEQTVDGGKREIFIFICLFPFLFSTMFFFLFIVEVKRLTPPPLSLPPI